ncbi:ComEC/Rec2 family competence protein [Synechocystis sp. LKSZ1]|uniref:ComEC/Rec2 family competence protein n=1 Tax=Synechocystis sp. LKSZ1 TaxID=3144951 RepID=UPI00336C1082
MLLNPWAIICLTYLAGLLSTAWLGLSPAPSQWMGLSLGWLLLAGSAAIFGPRRWPRGPGSLFWLSLALVALLAAGYLQWRLPQPSAQDISQALQPKATIQPTVTVVGHLLGPGQENARGGQQFWLAAELVQKEPDLQFRSTTGQLYMTLPAAVAQQWLGCEKIRVTGQLYQPRSPKNPSQFDFSAYLQRRGVFAGLRGQRAETAGQGFCWPAQLRQRIVQAQSQGLPKNTAGISPEGQLLSSIVLGQKAVSLPYGLRALFSQVGLSHLLAASGYQVSLLVGTVLSWGQSQRPRYRLGLALGILLLYLMLTGLQPSVVRAALLWLGVMVAVVNERKLNPLGALLLVATAMTLVNPVSIWDLGFQLSFLATLGILVTAPYLQEKLDFLPPKISEIISVPLAATLWTTPLLIGQFSQFSWVAIPLNIIVTPLIELLSLGGMLSALGALLWPGLGTLLALPLLYPTQALMYLAEMGSQFPALAVGRVAGGLVLLLYGAMILVWQHTPWRRYWLGASLGLWALVFLPLTYQQFLRTQVIVFHTPQQPVLLIQRQQALTLITDGQDQTEAFVLQPALAQNALNQSPCRLSSQELSSACPSVTWLSQQPPILEFTLQQKRWWVLLKRLEAKAPIPALPSRPDVLVWTGKFMPQAWLEALNPRTAIAVTEHVSQRTRTILKTQGSQLLVTGEMGAVLWTPHHGFMAEQERWQGQSD